MKNLPYRVIRKIAHISFPLALKTAKLLEKVENKSTRIITQSDQVKVVEGKPQISIDTLFSQHLPQASLLYPALPEAGRKPAVNLLIPTLSKELVFGGIATALIAAVTVAKESKKDLRVVQTFKFGDSDIRGFLDAKGIEFHGEINVVDVSEKNHGKKVFLDLHPEDIYMASAWADAFVLDKLPLTNKFIYLIQDFEPIFYPNGDENVRSESTYRSNNYVALCNTELLHQHLTLMDYEAFKNTATTWFEPAVCVPLTKKKEDTQKKRLFIYGRPRVKRNLYLSALEAINTAVQSESFNKDEWEIYMAGEDNIPDIVLDGGVKINVLGKMSLDDYYDFMQTIDIAVSPMMAPHPNYPTLEFASVGAKVVTTSFSVKTSLKKYSDNISVVAPNAQAMSNEIIRLIGMAGENKKVTGLKISMTDWEENISKPVKSLLKQI